MLLKLGYIGLALLMTLILVAISIKTKPKEHFMSLSRTIMVLIGWQIYIYVLALTGFIENLDFPPRFVILTIVPAFIFIGWFAFKIKKSEWLDRMPAHWLIFYQTFRIIIETLFVFTVNKGLLHPNVTLKGYNYDMVFAFSAFLVGWLVWKGYLKVGLIWNYLGLGVIAFIIFLFQTTIYSPEIYGSVTETFPVEFLRYPYILVPAFLMPSAVFIHVVSIVQLKQKLAQNKQS